MSKRRFSIVRLFGAGMLVALSVAAVVGCSGSSGEGTRVGAEINAFEISSGAHRTGYPLLASAGMRSTATVPYTYWMGYSVQNPKGEWYDAPAIPVELTPGQDSGARGFTTEALNVPGLHTARTAIWTDDPADKDAGASLLDKSQTTFRVYEEREDFDLLDPDRWQKSDASLGRSKLRPDSVNIKDGNLRLKIPKKSLDGTEISSENKYSYGSYTARMKVPNAPTSITGFFLYEPPDFQSEVDIEIHNDPKGKILFTTYAGGEQTHTRTMDLPFDPTKEFHDYGFEYRKDKMIFHVDNRPMVTFDDDIPNRPMNLYVNTWYPQWLAGEETSQDQHVLVDSIEN